MPLFQEQIQFYQKTKKKTVVKRCRTSTKLTILTMTKKSTTYTNTLSLRRQKTSGSIGNLYVSDY